MRIVVKSAASGKWKLVESADYDNEAELQALLAESPSLIPVDEIREGLPPLVAAVREFGLPGSGSTDLLAFSAEGDVVRPPGRPDQVGHRRCQGLVLVSLSPEQNCVFRL